MIKISNPLKVAVYAGSFDPITNGHAWVIEQAARMFDLVIVAVGHNPAKKYTFDVEQRLGMVDDFLSALQSNPEFRDKVAIGSIRHDQYLVHYAREEQAQYLIRGVRGIADFEYEYTMRQINADLAPEITTVFLTPPRELAEVSSSMVKGLVGPENWEQIVSKMVPANVFKALRGRQQ